ncbi:hypothetical protein HUO13_34065 [Saccharopolyspora erythraea]|uniref:hypothetical protein n=1 Tax=Saccharopolyspora erythraea TaxID=1836 RepID=UPI001BA619FB|nr:hypothetical protein [Saccharopolyspora erythraea]QUG99395.1 hypothetical protein HUO13_34065 [Saccharopolyspora erythraea]
MNTPHPPYGQPQQPGYLPQQPGPGYPPQAPPGYQPQPPQYPGQQQVPYPQQPYGHPGYGQAPSGGSRVGAIIVGVAAIIVGLYVVIDFISFTYPMTMILMVPGGLVLMAAGVLLILRQRISVYLTIAATALFAADMIRIMVTRVVNMDEDQSVADVLYNWASVATLVPAAVIMVLTLLPFVRNTFKPTAPAGQAVYR